MERTITAQLSPAFRRSRLVNGFKYDISRDLSGYEDGTENPEGDDAIAAAVDAVVGRNWRRACIRCVR